MAAGHEHGTDGMDIGVIGSGDVGRTLAAGSAAAGHAVLGPDAAGAGDPGR